MDISRQIAWFRSIYIYIKNKLKHFNILSFENHFLRKSTIVGNENKFSSSFLFYVREEEAYWLERAL